jgi:integrase
MEANQSLTKAARIDTEAIIKIVIDGAHSPHSQLAYRRAIRDFLIWYEKEGGPPLAKSVVQRYAAALRAGGMTPQNINQRLSAIRKLALEASDNGGLDGRVAEGIKRIKGIPFVSKSHGNWLSIEEAQHFLLSIDPSTLRGARDRAIIAIGIGCGLRRSEISNLTFEHLQQRAGRWAIVGLAGKRGKIRDVPMAAWTKAAIDRWSLASGIAHGRIFRPINKGGRLAGEKMTPESIRKNIIRCATTAGIPKIAAHDLRRTFAKLARNGGALLEQLQLSLGHTSLTTTEKYFGSQMDWQNAPADYINLRIG